MDSAIFPSEVDLRQQSEIETLRQRMSALELQLLTAENKPNGYAALRTTIYALFGACIALGLANVGYSLTLTILLVNHIIGK